MILLRTLAVLLTASLVLAGCAGGQAGSGRFDTKAQEEFAAAVYQAMQDRALNGRLPPNTTATQVTIGIGLQVLSDLHLAPRETFEMVVAGFANLARKEPAFHFTIGDRDIEVSSRGKRLHRFALPPDRAFPDWGLEVDKSIQEYLKQRPGSGGLSSDALYDAFLEGVASAFGPLTHYATREDVRIQERFLTGDLADVGLGTEVTDVGAVILAILDVDLLDDPLLKQGNTIVSIDGQDIRGLDWITVEELFIGPVGSSATLGIQEAGKDSSASVTVGRIAMGAPSLRSRRIGDQLIVEIVRFDRGTAIELIDTLRQASQNGPEEVTGVILDFRNNPQGQLDSGIAIADIFLEDGKVVSTWGRHESTRKVFEARANAATNRLPVIVLIGEKTQGVPEVVAAALQDLERALVVGQASHGSGPISGGLRLANGGAFNFPIAEIFAASGYRLNTRGVMPTVCTSGAETAEAVIDGLRRERRMTDRTTRTRDIDPADAAEIAAFHALCPARSGGRDIDLAVAQALLEDAALYAEILSASNLPGQSAARLP